MPRPAAPTCTICPGATRAASPEQARSCGLYADRGRRRCRSIVALLHLVAAHSATRSSCFSSDDGACHRDRRHVPPVAPRAARASLVRTKNMHWQLEIPHRRVGAPPGLEPVMFTAARNPDYYEPLPARAEGRARDERERPRRLRRTEHREERAGGCAARHVVRLPDTLNSSAPHRLRGVPGLLPAMTSPLRPGWPISSAAPSAASASCRRAWPRESLQDSNALLERDRPLPVGRTLRGEVAPTRRKHAERTARRVEGSARRRRSAPSRQLDLRHLWLPKGAAMRRGGGCGCTTGARAKAKGKKGERRGTHATWDAITGRGSRSTARAKARRRRQGEGRQQRWRHRWWPGRWDRREESVDVD